MKHTVWIAAILSAPLAFGQSISLGELGLGLATVASSASLVTARTPPRLQAPIALALSPDWRVGVGLRMSDSPDPTTGMEVNTVHRAALDLMPSYALTDALTVYGKLSTAPATALSLSTMVGLGNSLNLNSLDYGVGIHAQLDKNLFLQGALDLNHSNDWGTSKSGASVLSMGLGYRF